jgi:hypothetical protein
MHTHIRTESGNFSMTRPHSEHLLVDGKKRGAKMTFEPYHRLLYSSILRNDDQPPSEM